jgi:hypothetical protein
MLLNECETIVRDNERIHLAGIDDAHYYRVDNIEKAASAIPHGEFSILLSHTPEIYRQAAHADFKLLCGHTHGGQICLPGSIPITLDSVGVGSCDRCRTSQLPPGNHTASPASCLIARIGLGALVWAIPQFLIVVTR